MPFENQNVNPKRIGSGETKSTNIFLKLTCK